MGRGKCFRQRHKKEMKEIMLQWEAHYGRSMEFKERNRRDIGREAGRDR